MNRVRLRALILLLPHSGLRIGDAVTLSLDRITIVCDEEGAITEGKLFLYTAKTGAPVYCPLPRFVVTALAAIPNAGRFCFRIGEFKRKGLIGGTWWRRLNPLIELAGVPIERVSILLGHQSVRETERHYSAWVRARQEQLEAHVRGTWGVQDAATSEEQAKGERAKGANRGTDEGIQRVHGARVQ